MRFIEWLRRQFASPEQRDLNARIVQSQDWVRTVHLYSLLKWLDKWVPETFGPDSRADYNALRLLAFHVVPRLVQELRDRDAKGFALYMGGGARGVE